MEIKADLYTDAGNHREANEDFIISKPDLGLFVVCDGIGGHAAGATASRKATEVVEETIREEIDLIAVKQTEEIKSYLSDLVNSACKEIYRLANTVQDYAGMGTTLTMLLLQERKAYMAHVGDSRLYLYRSGRSMH